VERRIEPLRSQLLVLLQDLGKLEEHEPVKPFLCRKIRIFLEPEKDPLLLADSLSLYPKARVIFRIKGRRKGELLRFARKAFRKSGNHPEHKGFSVDGTFPW